LKRGDTLPKSNASTASNRKSQCIGYTRPREVRARRLVMSTVTLEVEGLFEELDHLGVEKRLRAERGVRRASSNAASGSVTIDYDETVTSAETLQRTVQSCGFRCRGKLVPRQVCKPGPAPHDEVTHAMGHGAGMDMQDMVRDMRNRF